MTEFHPPAPKKPISILLVVHCPSFKSHANATMDLRRLMWSHSVYIAQNVAKLDEWRDAQWRPGRPHSGARTLSRKQDSIGMMIKNHDDRFIFKFFRSLSFSLL